MRSRYLFIIASLFVCLSFALNARTIRNNNSMVVTFKQGFKPLCTQRNHMVSFSITELDELNFKYNCVAAKRIDKFEKNAPYTYVLRFSEKTDLVKAMKAYKATDYFAELEPLAKR